jgi:deoxyribodipyrimidine photo-lyase
MQPFIIPSTYKEFECALLQPVLDPLPGFSPCPPGVKSSYLTPDGEEAAKERLESSTEGLEGYCKARQGLGDGSLKLSAHLAQGCISARQIYKEITGFEEGVGGKHPDVGFGKGETEDTKALKSELLWRDYMRLCLRKFKRKFFQLSGFRGDNEIKWRLPTDGAMIKELDRVLCGTTGMGLVDASQRELYHTGFTSDRARLNTASFFRRLRIDWRYGAECYEMLLIDYDVASNWAGRQYIAGGGNDPRKDRVFNPVSQALAYDQKGDYMKRWVVEVKELTTPMHIFQPCMAPPDDLGEGRNSIMVTNPLCRIQYTDKDPQKRRREGRGGRGRGRGWALPEVREQESLPTGDASGSPDWPNGQPPRGPRGRGRGGRGGGRGNRLTG